MSIMFRCWGARSSVWVKFKIGCARWRILARSRRMNSVLDVHDARKEISISTNYVVGFLRGGQSRPDIDIFLDNFVCPNYKTIQILQPYQPYWQKTYTANCVPWTVYSTLVSPFLQCWDDLKKKNTNANIWRLITLHSINIGIRARNSIVVDFLLEKIWYAKWPIVSQCNPHLTIRSDIDE